MNRSLDARLRNLEAEHFARPLHIIWSITSDREEWARKRAELIASGKAMAEDKFLHIGWRRTPLRAKRPSPDYSREAGMQAGECSLSV
jgi:hypothetical protein